MTICKVGSSALKLATLGLICLALLFLHPALAAGDNTVADAGVKNSRLANASSPYLRLHVGDAVLWYQWSDETFALAAKLNRPLLVSFGYTACHWCHVMQQTHFNVKSMAKTINDNFIPVIVDRERRPELDETYMLVTEALTQRGGWPNTVFLTPERKPFYGTGYIPATDFSQLLTAIVEGWVHRKPELVGEAERLSGVLQQYLTRRENARDLSSKVVAKAARDIAGQFDEFAGGLGRGPKFFQPTVLMFLMQQFERNNEAALLSAVETTLQAIASGGIHDLLDGGLHRYAVDPGWRVPHFEKMLYDQASMTRAYVEAYRITGKVEYGLMARKLADYVLQDLTSPEGGFYATRDADSDGEEGTFYVWSKQQLNKILGAENAAYAIKVFEMVGEGDLAGKIILNRDNFRQQTIPRVERILARLAVARARRVKPQRDEKIVVSWNGLMISSLARAALILGEERYSKAAIRAGQFLWDHLRDKNGHLLRSYFSGRAEIKAELVDYAFLARSYIDIHDLSGQVVWLARARDLFQIMEDRFADKQSGDFYSSRGTIGFGRLKSRQDSDIASGNGVALDLMVALAKRDDGTALFRRSEKMIAALSGIAAKNPISGASILMAADRFLRGQDGPVQYGGGGAVRVHAVLLDRRKRGEKNRISVRITVADGWHINAHKPLEDYLIATDLSVVAAGKSKSAAISYPKPEIKHLGFSPSPLALLEGEFEITAEAVSGGKAPYDVKLVVQACSDKICLAADTLKFRISPPLSAN